MNYDLPKSVNIGGSEYEIRSDFRAALDICAALCDENLTDNERAEALFMIFYPDYQSIPEEYHNEAIKRCFWFLRGGSEERDDRRPQLISWEQDFDYIAPPVSRVVGQDIRGISYFHWWSFLSAYREIGDCFFAQIVGIRSKIARGRKLDKQDREFYKRNKNIIDLKKHYTQEEEEILKEWM